MTQQRRYFKRLLVLYLFNSSNLASSKYWPINVPFHHSGSLVISLVNRTSSHGKPVCKLVLVNTSDGLLRKEVVVYSSNDV